MDTVIGDWTGGRGPQGRKITAASRMWDRWKAEGGTERGGGAEPGAKAGRAKGGVAGGEGRGAEVWLAPAGACKQCRRGKHTQLSITLAGTCCVCMRQTLKGRSFGKGSERRGVKKACNEGGCGRGHPLRCESTVWALGARRGGREGRKGEAGEGAAQAVVSYTGGRWGACRCLP